MSELRLYNRRPSCLMRYQHGGYAAIFPLGQKTVLGIFTAKIGTSNLAIAAEALETGNVLPFPCQTDRPGRKQKSRPKSRPSGRKKT